MKAPALGVRIVCGTLWPTRPAAPPRRPAARATTSSLAPVAPTPGPLNSNSCLGDSLSPSAPRSLSPSAPRSLSPSAPRSLSPSAPRSLSPPLHLAHFFSPPAGLVVQNRGDRLCHRRPDAVRRGQGPHQAGRQDGHQAGHARREAGGDGIGSDSRSRFRSRSLNPTQGSPRLPFGAGPT